jgi:hypothetical protein
MDIRSESEGNLGIMIMGNESNFTSTFTKLCREGREEESVIGDNNRDNFSLFIS